MRPFRLGVVLTLTLCAIGCGSKNPVQPTPPKLSGLAIHGADAVLTGATARDPLLPDVPTLAEQKVPLQIVPWAGLFAPAGTPKEIVALLNQEVAKALKAADVREAAAGFGFELYGNTPEEFAKTINSDLARTSKVIRDAGIKPE